MTGFYILCMQGDRSGVALQAKDKVTLLRGESFGVPVIPSVFLVLSNSCLLCNIQTPKFLCDQGVMWGFCISLI